MSFGACKAAILFVILVAIWIQPAFSQQTIALDNQISYTDLVRRSYGLDQNLINGVQFFDRYMGCKGVPYFMSIGFVEGNLTIQERNYSDARIRYDLVAQKVEIEYDNLYSGYGWLISVLDHLEAFQLGNYSFRKLNLDGGSEKFYQVIQTAWFTCYVHWEKKLNPLQGDAVFTHEFSKINSSCLVEIDGELSSFRNRKALVERFPEHLQREIKRLLKKNLFSVQRASPDDFIFIMNDVAQLISEGGLP